MSYASCTSDIDDIKIIEKKSISVIVLYTIEINVTHILNESILVEKKFKKIYILNNCGKPSVAILNFKRS